MKTCLQGAITSSFYNRKNSKFGNYLGTEPEARGIVFGGNRWEEIPELNEINFENHQNVTYDVSVQLLID